MLHHFKEFDKLDSRYVIISCALANMLLLDASIFKQHILCAYNIRTLLINYIDVHLHARVQVFFADASPIQTARCRHVWETLFHK